MRGNLARAGWLSSAAAAMASLALILAGAGCQSKGTKGANPPATAGAAGTSHWRVAADTTSFYKYGPEQANGADQTLKKDAEITMIKRSRGFSEVTLPSGETGYVGTEDITQLTDAEVASELATEQAAAQAASLGVSPSSAIVGAYTIPPEAGQQQPLPVADGAVPPKPSPSPTFRY